MKPQQPSVSRAVHYVSYGTPGGEYASVCRAAVIAEVLDGERCALAVLNPTGLFFHDAEHSEQDYVEDSPGGPLLRHRTPAGGTWHWPERT